MQVDAGKLAINTVGPEERTLQWEGTDTVTEGDRLVIEDVDEAVLLLVRYEGEVLARTHTAELGEEGSDGTAEGSDSATRLLAPVTAG